MNQLIAMNAEVTMSSEEISNMVGSRHDNVKRTINTLASSGVITFPQTEEKPTGGRPTTIYVFSGERGKRDSIIVVAQLCPEFTARLVDRWQELESQAKALPNFNDPVAAARALADAVELRIEAQQQLAIAAPKAEVFDKVMERDTLINATQVAQQVGMSAIRMNKKLDEIGGVYNKCVKRGRAFCHDLVLSGYGEMKMTPQGYPQPLFTAKGSLRVAEIFTSEGLV